MNVKCKVDSFLRKEIEFAVYYFPGVVAAAHKRRDTLPHCIFAIENLVRKAVQGVLEILSPGNDCMCVHSYHEIGNCLYLSGLHLEI